MKVLIVLCAMFALATANGCVPKSTPLTLDTHKIPAEKYTRIVDKNYVLGDENVAFVGQKIVSIYERDVIYRTSIVATNDYYIQISADGFERFKKENPMADESVKNAKGMPGTELKYSGDVAVDGKIYAAACGTSYICLCIDDNNEFSGTYFAYVNGSSEAFFFKNSHEIKPNTTRFEKKRVIADTGFVGDNFDIIYTGKDSGKVSFKYREYTRDNIAKPAFSHDLTYPPDATSIRYKNIKIQIIKATAEDIRYRVIED